MVKNPPANSGDTGNSGSIPGSGQYFGGGNGNPLGILAWRMPWTEEPGMGGTAVHGVTISWA